jgi:Phage P22-like portal protein
MLALSGPMSDYAETEPGITRPKVVEQAIERLKLAAEAEREQRGREKEDLSFQVPECQWTEEAKAMRKGQLIGGVTLPGRPTLSIPKLDQPVQLVLNQEKGAHLGVQIHALSEEADDDTAEVIQGLYRRIETDSRANLARSWAFERAVKCGRGAYRVLTEYDPSSPKGTNDQRIVIKRLLYQDSAYFDPFAVEPDWCDGEWAFVTSWIQFAKYQRVYGTTELAGYDTELLNELSEECPDWIKGDGEARAVLITEYFCVEGEGDDRKVIWRKLNAVEVLEEQIWPGRYIPIVPVIGRELIPFDGERRWTGIIGPNKDGQRLFNYAASTAVEAAAQEPKATWILAEGQEEGHEQEFLLANVRNFPYVRYKPTTIADEQTPPPVRSQVDTSKLGLSMQMLSMASEFLHSGTGAFEPSLGQESTRQKSGRAVLALQQQHDQGNSNWLDNLAEISLTYEAKVVLDLIPHIYDRPGRVARILDMEDNAETVLLNQPYTKDPKTGRPVPVMGPQPQADTKHYDLTAGTYGVTISVGKAYKSRLEEGNDMLGQLFQAEPELFKVLGDLWLKFQTWPGHQEAAERVKKMLPPPLQESKDGQTDPKVELEQAKAMLQQMQQQMSEMAKALETDKVKADAQIEKSRIDAGASIQKARIDADHRIQLQAMQDATALAVAKINALVKGVVVDAEAEDEAIALAREHAFQASEAEKDRQHQAQIAQQQARHDAALAAAGAGMEADQAAQTRQHEAEMGQMGHQQNLEAAQQQAALQPPQPEAGA